MSSEATYQAAVAALHPNAEQMEKNAAWFESLGAATAEMTCIVGAGLSGLEAASVMIRDGARDIVILERRQHAGGIWVTGANPESRVQVDPVSFAPLDDARPVRETTSDAFDSIAKPAAEVLQRLQQRIAGLRLHERIVYGVELVSFRGLSWSSVEVVVRLPNGETKTLLFRELHLRTGNLAKPRRVNIPGEENLLISAYGVGGDVSLEQMRDKHVTIVGSGAFAVENVRRALLAGARTPVVVLTRHLNKCIFPEFATYTLRHTLNSYDEPGAFRGEDNAVSMWRTTTSIIRTVAELCGMAAKVLNNECIRSVSGEDHVLFNHGIPPMSGNLMYLAHHYGLVRYEQGEIESCDEGVVVTKAGERIRTDVLLKCLGFTIDSNIMEAHAATDAYFVDYHCNITHNLRGDHVNGTLILGPYSQCRNFLISYYEDAEEYERAVVQLNNHHEAYREVLEMQPTQYASDISTVDYLTTIVLSDKLARCTHEAVRGVLRDSLARRRDLYASALPREEFLRLDQQYWDKLSAEFARRSGQPQLSYPFSSIAFGNPALA